MNQPDQPDSPAAARPSPTGDAPPRVAGAGTLGVALLILSLSVLFIASMIAYLVIRARAQVWPPPDMPRLPAGLWVSTIILLTSSGTVHWALRSVRLDRQGAFRVAMLLTTLLGIAFLVSQTINWIALIQAHVTPRLNLYAFSFFVLTALHGLHVIGGLVPLVVVTRRSFQGRYSSTFYAGVRYCTMYWHFLDVVWLVMFTLIFLIA
jgi:cytochrome c oxidase subunit 3